jgi:hypothetical protein
MLMTLCRVTHNKNYTTVNNTIADDNRISWRAKGLWFFAFSRRNDWKFYIKDLVNRSTDGKESVRKGLLELEEYGYLERIQSKDSTGKFTAFEYIFHEVALEIKIILPQSDLPIADLPISVNPPLVSTQSLTSTKQQQQAGDGDLEERIHKLKENLVSQERCTPEEFDRFNLRFFRKAVKLYGIETTFKAVIGYFYEMTPKERKKIDTPTGFILNQLEEFNNGN